MTQTSILMPRSVTTTANAPVTLAVLAESMARMLMARRDALLAEVASIEAELGYGAPDKPTTAQIREAHRRGGTKL